MSVNTQSHHMIDIKNFKSTLLSKIGDELNRILKNNDILSLVDQIHVSIIIDLSTHFIQKLCI